MNKNEKEINRLLKRGVVEVIVEEELRGLLRSGKKLRLKEGFDPSAPDIHLGHMVSLKKLRQFQELGHQVVLIVGDWTAQIGDPSGMSATRPMLSAEEVRANAETYMNQFFKIVDREKTEVRWQTEWFGKFNLSDVIRLTSKFTIAQFLAREDFNKRYNAGQPIAITEFLYPLLQAYDSVAVQADVEFGSVDQKFNFLVGRELQSMMGQPPQQCFMTPILIGTDGSQKMSKSLGNYIGVAEPPEEMYGKVMSIPDSLILQYFELLTDVPDEELAEFKRAMTSNSVNPMEVKKRLARELVSELYDRKAAATEAEEHFTQVFQERGLPDEIPEFPFSFKKVCKREVLDDIPKFSFSFNEVAPVMDERGSETRGALVIGLDDWDVSYMLLETRQAKSRSEAIRLIRQGAVSVDGQKITGNVATVKSGSIIKVGRRFAKVINTDRI